MPKVARVAVTYGRKINLGNYESANVEASAWVDLDEGDEPAATFARAFASVRAAVHKEAAKLVDPDSPPRTSIK